MDFEEALTRFSIVKPEDVKESVQRSKGKTPGGGAARRRPKKDEQEV